MTVERIILGLVLMVQVFCVEAARQNLMPNWTPFLALAGTVLMAFMNSVKESQ